VKAGKTGSKIKDELGSDRCNERPPKPCQHKGCTHNAMPGYRWCRRHLGEMLHEIRNSGFFRPVPRTIAGLPERGEPKPQKSAIVGLVSSRLR
jgi:hypothetical protein